MGGVENIRVIRLESGFGVHIWGGWRMILIYHNDYLRERTNESSKSRLGLDVHCIQTSLVGDT